MIAENTTVIIFNYFYLKDQIAYVKSFLDIDKSNNRLKFYSDFLEYLFRNANMNDKIECFEIIAHNEEEKIISIYKALMSLNAIRLLYNCVEFLYYKNEYDKQEIINFLNNFKEVEFELRYPNKNFKDIYNKISSLKQKGFKVSMSFKLFICRIKQTNEFFRNNKNFKTVDISASVETIDNFSFFGCSSIEYVRISSNIRNIGKSAFYGCTSLKEVTFYLVQNHKSPKLESIGDYAFYNCSS